MPLSVPAKRFVPLNAKDRTAGYCSECESYGKPLFTAAQLVPVSVERKTPLSFVPAKRSVPLVARHENGFQLPLSASAQLVPLLVERKTLLFSLPKDKLVLLVSANKFMPLTSRVTAEKLGSGKPLSTAVHLAPLSFDRKTPSS